MPQYTQRELVVSWLVIGVIFFVVGLGAGARLLAPDSAIIQCEEDEVWYPEDFTGSEQAGDLSCLHIDVIKGE